MGSNVDNIGALEIRVMLAVARLQPGGYGRSVVEAIAAIAGRPPSESSVYTTLDRLGRKRYVKTRLGEKNPVRGGRRKTHFALSAKGVAALRSALAAIDALRAETPFAR